jgi:hypothetical protein
MLAVLKEHLLPLLTPDQLDAKLKQLQGKPGVKVKTGTTQKRPRCFSKEKVPLLYGTYYGPIVKDKRSGEGIFVWWPSLTQGRWLVRRRHLER